MYDEVSGGAPKAGFHLGPHLASPALSTSTHLTTTYTLQPRPNVRIDPNLYIEPSTPEAAPMMEDQVSRLVAKAHAKLKDLPPNQRLRTSLPSLNPYIASTY